MLGTPSWIPLAKYHDARSPGYFKLDSTAKNDYVKTLDMELQNAKYPFELTRPASPTTPNIYET